MKRSIHKTDLFWLASVLTLLAFQFWFPWNPVRRDSDTWSVSPAGKKAFYRLAEQQNDNVVRNAEPIPQLLTRLSDNHHLTDATLCILGPARSPTDREWNAILDWVQMGGHLLYAVPEQATAELHIPRVNISTVLFDSDESAEFRRPDAEEIRLGDIASQLTSDDENYDWISQREVSGKEAIPILVFDDTIQVSRQRYGRGELVVVASDDIFTNEAMLIGDNALLAWRLFEQAEIADEMVYVDESLNQSGTPKMMAILFDPLIRPATLQVLLVVCLYCWFASHRFGPYAPASVEPRRNIVDHTDMVGLHFYKRKNGAHALRVYLKQLIAELKLKQHKGREERILSPIAVRMGCTGDELISLFREAAQAARGKFIDRRTASKLIHRLSHVRASARPGSIRSTET